MKFTILLTSLTLCCVNAAEIFPGGKGVSGNVEERRASATGKKMDSFRTMAGRAYRDVMITEITDGGISFTHEDGAARLRFENLNPEQRRYFGIEEDDAQAVYGKERMERIAYEAKVEQREEERRELAEKKAAERAEARRVAFGKAEKAEAERTVAAASQPAAEIPLRPTIKRVDSGGRSSRRHSSHNTSYGGYSYPVRHYYSPVFRYGGSYCRPGFGTAFHFSVR